MTIYPLFFVNSTGIEHAGRTTETVIKPTLQSARKEARGRYGYIVRQDGKTSRVIEFFGGFKPDDREQRYIDAIG